MSPWKSRIAGVVVVAFLIACGGLLGDSETAGPSPEVAEALEKIEGTMLAAAETLPPISLDGAAAPDVDVGDGVQILQIAPVGVGRKALQAAVVFDRPMVPLGDLDSMNDSVPLACTPEIPGRARWAGTSTAVYLPEGGSFPRGTAFTCTVAAGTTALDDVTLEKALSWDFETPRPVVVSTWPRADAVNVDLDTPVRFRFDQPMEPDAVLTYVSVKENGRAVSEVTVEPVESGNDHEVAISFERRSDAAYVVAVARGVVGVEGPLPSTEAHSLSFETYPPLRVQSFEPASGEPVSPGARLALSFTTEVSQAEIAAHLTIEPSVAHWSPPDGDWTSQWWAYGVVLQPQTAYTVRLKAGLEDVHGQPLAGPSSWTFSTGDYDPWLSVPRGLKLYAANNPAELPYKHLNAARVDMRFASITPSDLTQVRDWRDAAEAVLASGGRDAVGAGVEAANVTKLGAQAFDAYLGDDGFGWVATRFRAPNVVDWEGEVRDYVGLMVVTDLGGTLKIGPNAAEVWVTSLERAVPVEGVEVEVFAGTKRVGSATTDADGLARVEGAPTADWKRWDQEIWAVLRKGQDTSLVRQEWNDGLSPYTFGIYGSFEARGHDEVAQGFLDRGVYRPGDPVYARATFRLATAAGLEIPSGAVEWIFEDPRGDTIESGSGSLDARGGFSWDNALPADGALGDYRLRISAKGVGWSETVWLHPKARAYRPPAFRVDVTAPANATVGESVEGVADARYLFGAPLRKGDVRWNAWTEARWFRPEGWDGWSFGPEYRWWEDGDGGGDHGLLGDAQQTIVDGRTTFSQTVPPGSERPVALFLEATVEDVDRQAISNRAEVLVHPGAFYVGARTPARLPKVGEATPVEVVAVDPDGRAVSGVEVTVEVSRRTWTSIREKGMGGQWRWVNTVEDEAVFSSEVTSASDAAQVAFTPEEAGYHVVRVTAKDADGHEVSAHDSLYVVGSGFVGWGRSDDTKMELVPEKRTFAPGETARILVKAPADGMRALVTVERQGVLWRDVVTLDGAAATVEVPITEASLPNVFVSVLAVQGAGPQDGPDKGRPQVFMGMVELDVQTEQEHLSVAVEPDRNTYGPRDTVEVDIVVARDGAPVPGAGVTLFAVDEAILSLTAYQTPDAHEAFYAHHALSVLTADGRVAALDRAPFLTKGASRGGDGGMAGETGPETRTKFLTTITWQPDLTTGPDGAVHATFELPDNLTTFRIMAVADAGATSFGSGDREIRVTRPLIVRPALPRLLRAGDEAYAGVVVHNDAIKPRPVRVEAEVSGPVELTGAPVSIRIPARSSVEVPFTLKALEEGEATFTFRAIAGSDRDALEWKLPVGRDVILETTATAGMVDDAVTEQIARPDNASSAFGGLKVDVATTALVGAGAGLDYLVRYPHGCVEQKTSRALGSLMALQVRERAGVEVSEEVLRRNVEGVLGELAGFRVGSGGLSYWKGGDWPSVMGTAYAVEFMGRAEQAGFDVDQATLDHGVQYLRDYASGKRVRGGFDEPLLTLSAQAYVASALARAGQGDAGLNGRLYPQRRNLSVFATAGLLEAILTTTGKDARTQDLERTIASRTTIEAASASVKENGGGQWARMWASDDLSTAAALEALLASNPDHPLAPRYALHLASSRRTGHWANTRATAAALAALARYAELREADGDAVTIAITLAGNELMAQQLAVPGSAGIDLPLGEVDNGDLVFAAEGGPFYYQTRLSYLPKDLVPRDEGFTVTRSFEIMEGGGDQGQVTAGALVRATLTVVTPVVRHDVAVVDRFPAGMEPMDGSLATTSRAPREAPAPGQGTDELPDYGGSWVFDHNEVDDDQVRLYADYMPPGVHTFRYLLRATTPGTFDHPAATVEEMYEPENFGRTRGGSLVVGAPAVAER